MQLADPDRLEAESIVYGRLMRYGSLQVGVMAVVVGLIAPACSDPGLEGEVSAVREQLEELSAAQQALDARVADIEATVRTLEIPADASQEISLLGSELRSLSGQIEEVADQVSDNEFAIDDLQRCVNEYMDTIGSWSSNVNSRYTYYYC